MKSFLLLPLIFLKFWYLEAPRGMFGYFASLNHAFFELFSLPLFLRTFFQPLKNEYRQGLVWFSRFMGMSIKSALIVIDLAIFLVLLAFEALILIAFLAFPIITVSLLLYV